MLEKFKVAGIVLGQIAAAAFLLLLVVCLIAFAVRVFIWII